MKRTIPILLAIWVFVAPKAEAFEIHFSVAEGYPAQTSPLDGTPAGSPVWLSSNGFFVNGTDKCITANPKMDSAVALLARPIPLAQGQTVTVSVDFRFQGPDLSGAIGANGIQVPGIGFGASPSQFYQTAFNVLLGHFSWSSDDYTLHVTPNGKVANFSAGELGLEDPGAMSAHLRYIIELTKGGTADEWTYQVTLLNVDSKVPAAEIYGSDFKTSEEFFKSPNIYLNLYRGNSVKEGGAAKVVFLSIKTEK